MEKSKSYLAAPEHHDCYYSLKKSYDLDKDFFYSYDVYSFKRGREDKDKDEDPSVGSDRGTKSQPKSSGKSVQSEELVLEVADSDMPHDQEGNLGDNEDEPRNETVFGRDWFKKPTPPQEPTDPDWNVGKITQEGPSQNWLMNLTASTTSSKSLKDFDELMSTLIDFSGYILNDLKIENLTQEVLLGPSFRLLKGTCSNYTELEYDFEEYYKALLEKLDWENPEGVTHVSVMRKHGYGYLEEIVVGRADNVLYRFKEGDFPRLQINDIEDMLNLVVQNRLINLSGDDIADFAIAIRMFTRSLINVTKLDTTRPDIRKRHPYTPYKDPQGFIYVDDFGRNMLMCPDELYKFSDGTLTRLLSSLEDITKNINMTCLPKRRWSKLEKKRAHFMIKDINKLLKERRMMRSLEKFIGGRLYGSDLRLLQRTI
ncbi:hypothetical protein Tco_1246254 [Tanacetum coccineum]